MSDDKSLLNQYCQKKHVALPEYSTEFLSDGFSCILSVENEQFNSLATHSTKKEAERDAARVAVQALLKNNSLKTHENLLNNLANISISGSVKKQTSPEPASPNTANTNGHSPLTPTVTGGRVIDNVYYRPNTTVAPPPGFPGSPPRNSTTHTNQQTKTGPPPLENRAGQPPVENRSGIPICITGPNIDHAKVPINKPYGAFPVAPPTSDTSEPPPLITVGQPPRGVAPARADKDVQDLEFYCAMSGLPSPIYTIYQERGRHLGKVRIGEMEFGRGWGYESFDEAKDSAAVVAIAGLALTQMRLSAQQSSLGKLVAKGQRQPPPLTVVPHSPPPSPSAVTQPLRPPHNSQPPRPPHNSQPSHPLTSTHFRPLTQHPPASPNTPPLLITSSVYPRGPPPTQPLPFTHPQAPPTQPNGLNPPAFYQKPISRGGPPQPSTSTPPSQAPPQPSVTTQPNMSANYKGLLNTYCQRNHHPVPTYECDSPDDITGYISTVTVNGVKYKSAVHGTKKAADADAAKAAMGILGVPTEEANKSSVPVPTTASTVHTSSTTAPSSSAFVSYKNLLQEKAQKEKQATPQYSTERTEEGFVSTVTVYVASGPSFQKTSSAHQVKKAAEQEAARLACLQLQLISA